MPLADGGRVVALALEHLGQRKIVLLEDRAPHGPDNTVEASPMVLPGQQGKTARRADARRTMPIGKAHALLSQSIQIRGRNL